MGRAVSFWLVGWESMCLAPEKRNEPIVLDIMS